jgi:hypothetical protein
MMNSTRRVWKALIILFFILILSSCACLTKTQIASINKYSCLLESYSDYPGTIIKEFIRLKYEVEQLNTGTFNDTAVNSKLWNSFNGKQKALKKAAKIDLAINVMAEYASALNKLSSEELPEKISKQNEKLGSNIDSLISLYNVSGNKKLPAGIGKLIQSSVSLIGSSYIKQRQAKELKKFIAEADILISVLTDDLKVELTNTVLKDWIPALKDDMKSRQINFLQNIPTSEYKVYFANTYNKEVARLIARIDNLEQLTNKTIGSVDQVKIAHKQLLDHLTEKKNIKIVLSETQNLYFSLKDIYINYQEIKSN